MAAETPICDFGWQAPDFRLEGVDGRSYALADVRGESGTLVMFICNHCPYVKAVIDRIVRDVAALEERESARSRSCRTTPRPTRPTPSTT
jgi:peroxiredoxin